MPPVAAPLAFGIPAVATPALPALAAAPAKPLAAVPALGPPLALVLPPVWVACSLGTSTLQAASATQTGKALQIRSARWRSMLAVPQCAPRISSVNKRISAGAVCAFVAPRPERRRRRTLRRF
jgi:hypothetical protein